MPLTSLLARTYLRYVIPVTVLSAIAFSPLLYLAMRVPVPGDANQVNGVVRTAWLLAGLSLVPLLILVGGVAPAVRSIASGAPASQLAALRDGAVSLVRAVLPVGFAVLAMLMGSLALAVPGIALFVLLSLTGATGAPDRDLAARLAASVSAARANLIAVALVLVSAIAITIVALVFLQRGLPMPLPKPVKPELLATFRLFARYAMAGIVLVAPLPAIALAALAQKEAPQRLLLIARRAPAVTADPSART